LASKSNIQWSDQDRAAAYVLWVSNDKNIRKTSRECGIPTNTLRYWVKGWNESGPPDAVLDEIPAQMYEFVHHANRVRQNAMDKLEELIPQAEVRQLSAIATVVGIMDDKIRLATGLATKRTETVQILPSREDMKELMSGFVDGLVGAAESRAGEIIDVEVEEQPESSGLLVLKG
jgi:transposase-like protein